MQIKREKGSHCFTFDRPNTLPDHLSRCSIACLGDVIATAQHYPNCSEQAKANKHTSLELSVQRISAQVKGRHYKRGLTAIYIYPVPLRCTTCLHALHQVPTQLRTHWGYQNTTPQGNVLLLHICTLYSNRWTTIPMYNEGAMLGGQVQV